jgi:hypothetical protein
MFTRRVAHHVKSLYCKLASATVMVRENKRKLIMELLYEVESNTILVEECEMLRRG